jgi:RNA 3'-terminal phosphate cyclase
MISMHHPRSVFQISAIVEVSLDENMVMSIIAGMTARSWNSSTPSDFFPCFLLIWSFSLSIFNTTAVDERLSHIQTIIAVCRVSPKKYFEIKKKREEVIKNCKLQ